MKPVTAAEVVTAALEELKGGSSVGVDGMPPELYQWFLSVFIPRMEAAMRDFLNRGYVLDDWTVSLMKCIPKFAQATQAQDMRPVASQNTAMKWRSTVVLV